jgi:hypothetical protein
VLGARVVPLVRPTVEHGGFPIPFPFADEPVVVALVAEPPAVEPAPAVPPLLCASANVLESASAPANAIVMSFMVVSLVDDQGKTTAGDGCSSAANTKTSANFASGGIVRKINAFRNRGEPEQHFPPFIICCRTIKPDA